MNLIEKLPIPACGLILATLSLGNLLQNTHPYLRYIFASIGIIFLILMLLKVILYPDLIKNDLKNPVIASSSGTFSMSLMVLSTYLAPFTSSISYGIWIIGVVLHILLIVYFTYHFIIRNFDISTVYPTYWIVFVGITMASITGHFHGLEKIDFIFFIVGFIGMLASTPAILYREFIYKQIPDMNKPLTCIFTALFSILIVGYLTSTPSVSYEFAGVMYAIACLFYIYSTYKLIRNITLDFYPSFSAFTFPFVISALATKAITDKVFQTSLSQSALTIETVIATAIVAYVVCKYIRFLIAEN